MLVDKAFLFEFVFIDVIYLIAIPEAFDDLLNC